MPGDEHRPPSGDLSRVTAVVLTHRRPRLAGDVVRNLLSVEGFSGDRVVLVVNGQGGLDDPALQAAVRVVRLPTNKGPAGGFRAGLAAAFEDPSTAWAYLCEDDVGLFDLPAPRVAAVLAAADRWAMTHRRPVGAGVAYGRRFAGHGHTVNIEPGPGADPFEPVDVAPWGSTLVARAVVERGVLPDSRWFFAYEDFDFFCRLRSTGLALLLDTASARAVATQQTQRGRDAAFTGQRPADDQEPWRGYYEARNFPHLARAHGTAGWQVWHVVRTVRRLQLAASWSHRRAIIHGLLDGLRGRLGPHPGYQRHAGELAGPAADRSGPAPPPGWRTPTGGPAPGGGR